LPGRHDRGHSGAAFGKGQFESGVAAKVLREYAADPFPYLDDAEKMKMMAPASRAQGRMA